MVPRNCLDLLLQKVLGAEQKYFKYLNFRLKILVYDNWLGIMPFYKQKLDGFHRKIFKNKSAFTTITDEGSGQHKRKSS